MGSWGALLSPLAERGGGGAQARQTHRTSFVVSTLAPTYPSRLSVSLVAVIRQLIAVGLSLEAACVTCAGQDTFPFCPVLFSHSNRCPLQGRCSQLE
ncbi:unnamed protein product [Chondrus crispus]|uniref:Uncharacterized protein n=1 Tax=Chondrus crispus TaxID=2769 RepID=R7QLK8_CHOCR|nr:unnamed protein product [Chondrus crispus]CDF38964.1 unnamed protein product [Chondrus crispus]|eukprot:XP_005718869.1 unnamed protein product [Chondrus crispus]